MTCDLAIGFTAFEDDDALDALIAGIEAEVRSHVWKVASPKGREAIRLLAFEIERSRELLDEAAADLIEAARRRIEAIEAARRKLRAQLTALSEEALRPVTEWEDVIHRAEDREAPRCTC
jgi:hypothetical protein